MVAQKKLRILLVEDEVLVRKSIAQIVRRVGYEVLGETSYAEEAVEISREQTPDLILMDIRLKGEMTGIEAAREINQLNGTPVLFLSAYDYGNKIEKENLDNTLGYMAKPFSDRQLQDFLSKIFYS
jgi:CheY-like chemotaxis protein